METMANVNSGRAISAPVVHPAQRLAVCSWSLQPLGPEDLIRKLAHLGIRRVQLSLNPLGENPGVWGATAELFRMHDISIVSGCVGCLGEDYTTLESIRLTGGIGPDATWEHNQRTFGVCAAIAEKLGLKLVTFHAGFLPPEESGAAYDKMVCRLQTVARIFQGHGVSIGLETGQETAPVLADLLRRLAPLEVGVNFDPANMILYDKGDPVQALQVLAPWIRQIHIKDARRTRLTGTWGQEMPVGQGEVDWGKFFAGYRRARLDADLVIEREYGAERVADIRIARNVVEQMLV